MPRSVKRKREIHGSGVKTGMAPGTMVFIGERKQENARVDVVAYSDTALEEVRDASVSQCGEFTRAPGVTWVHVTGVHDVGLIEEIGRSLDLHPLTLEDIVNTGQRLKVEEFPGYLFVVLKMVAIDEAGKNLAIENFSLVLGKNHVISFQEAEDDVFDAVRERIRSSKGRIRSMKSDYLAHALVDAVVDRYFLALERIGDRIEELEERVLVSPGPGDVHEIHRIRRDVLRLRKAVRPLREEIGDLGHSDSALIRHDTRVYWRDLYDHTIQIMDVVESFRDILGSMHDSCLSSISYRMNEIVKVLTIISTIFIPLTFIVGVYGMNFAHMPEPRWPFGYCLVWVVMLAVGIGLLAYFKWRKWI